MGSVHTRTHADQGAAIMAVLEFGCAVRISEDHHDLVNRGYIATREGSTFVLRRVGLGYEWQLAR